MPGLFDAGGLSLGQDAQAGFLARRLIVHRDIDAETVGRARGWQEGGGEEGDEGGFEMDGRHGRLPFKVPRILPWPPGG